MSQYKNIQKSKYCMQRVFSHIYVVKFQYFFMFKANKLHFFLRKKSYHHYKVTGSNIIKNETEKKMEKNRIINVFALRPKALATFEDIAPVPIILIFKFTHLNRVQTSNHLSLASFIFAPSRRYDLSWPGQVCFCPRY